MHLFSQKPNSTGKYFRMKAAVVVSENHNKFAALAFPTRAAMSTSLLIEALSKNHG